MFSKVYPNNVFLTFGTSGALFNTMAVSPERGTNILVPTPGFPLYQPYCENRVRRKENHTYRTRHKKTRELHRL